MFYSCPAGWRLRRCGLTWFIWSMCSRSAAIPGVDGWASMCGWPSVWHVMAIMIRAWVMAIWSASVRASVVWSGAAPVWVWAIPTVTLVIAGMWLGSGPAIPVPVHVMMPRSQSSMVYWSNVSFDVQVCLMVVFCLANLLLHDHTHCNQNILYSGNDGQCVLILGTGSMVPFTGHHIGSRLG